MTEHEGTTPSPDAPKETPRSAHSLAQSTATDVTAYLLAGPITFGAIGWAIDEVADTSYGVAIGALFGMAVALYLVWFRYGRSR